MIHILDKSTIDKIAAGEVVERPYSIVKELVENAIDAGATQITIEIKEGGIGLIRITDNGSGIEHGDVRNAFLRHATSKISSIEDLHTLHSLGFRGEALSSIAAVTRTELVTKVADEMTGSRYVIEGGAEKVLEEVGVPNGTTFIIKDLFYNTPVRKKFLKSATSEASAIGDLVEKLALSHPDIAFRFINNNQVRLQTDGNGKLKDIIYQIYGKEVAASLISVNVETSGISLGGYLAKPEISKNNRSFELFFVNGRYIKSPLLAKAVEEAYGTRMMQGKFPFFVLYIDIAASDIDVNVHPNKMEIRFSDSQQMYDLVRDMVAEVLSGTDLIKKVSLDTPKERIKEQRQREADIPLRTTGIAGEATEKSASTDMPIEKKPFTKLPESFETNRLQTYKDREKVYKAMEEVARSVEDMPTAYQAEQQISFLDEKARKKHRIIGQVFDTYWIIEYGEEMYIIDQHAAHEKVLYERFMTAFKEEQILSQYLAVPIILTLSTIEEEALRRHKDVLSKLGYEIEYFGGREYKVSSIPNFLPSVSKEEILSEIIDNLSEESFEKTPEAILEKTASLACKAAIKGNQKIGITQADILIGEMLKLENPYHCPHGRPTIIAMSKTELEKKFKRIV